jgi:glycosyltransferase involved in cell wall biosynthesis
LYQRYTGALLDKRAKVKNTASTLRVLNLKKLIMESQNRIKILTWHIHGSYLYYLSQGPFDIFLPTHEKKTEGYIGRGTTFPFGENVMEVPVGEVRNLTVDCILFQTPRNYEIDQYEILSEQQRQLPKVYLEHDPPQGVPTDTRHVVDDRDVTLVHVTHFNQLMWDCGQTPTRVIDHGVIAPTSVYNGKLDKGIVIINNLKERGRRLGVDIFLEMRKHIPLDLIGMDTKKIGGLGEILHPQLPEFIKDYRFMFNPIRYTSLGLAVIEAMMVGLPVAGLATTEMVTVIRNGHSGILHTDPGYLVSGMRRLLDDPSYAAKLGQEGRKVALDRFNIDRFTRDWHRLFTEVMSKNRVLTAA